MTSKSLVRHESISNAAFEQAACLESGFAPCDWSARAKDLFDALDVTANIDWSPYQGDLMIRNLECEFDASVDYVEIARNCMEQAFQQLATEFQESVSPLAKRIFNLLVTNVDDTSQEAYDYLIHFVEQHGLEGAAALTHHHRIGLGVFEDDDGVQSLHYGDYSSGPYSYDCLYCDMEQIVEAAEKGDEIADWLQDEDTIVVEVQDSSAAYGYVLMSKAQRDGKNEY